MPHAIAAQVERHIVSLSQFSELCGLEPATFRGVEYDPRSSTITLLTAGGDMRDALSVFREILGTDFHQMPLPKPLAHRLESDDMQTTGTFPQAHDNKTRKPAKKGKR